MNDNTSPIERQFREAEVRARRYWFADGLPEIVVGAVFGALGLYFAGQALIEHRAQPGGATNLLFNLLLTALVVIAGVVARRAIRAAKERMVYPRIGYVTYRESRRPWWLSAALGAAIAMGVTALARTAPAIEVWLPAGVGFLVSGGLLGLARLAGLPRLVGPALLAALVGVLVSLAHPSPTVGGAFFFGCVGLVLLVSGGLAFRRFLREAPPSERP